MKTQKGFTIIEGLLILVILGILGFTGWYVYNAHNKTTDTLTNADSANSSVAKYSKKSSTQAKDPTADWISYSSKEGIYSLKYPKTWVTATHPELCSPGILLLGADSKSVGICGSESFGQISVVSVGGDSQKDNALGAGYKGIVTATVTVDGVKGQKQTGTALGGSGDPGSLAVGTKIIKYVFYTNGRTYSATYLSADLSGKAYTDASSDFDLMVTKTLKFSN